MTPYDCCNIQRKTEGKGNILHTTLFTVDTSHGFADYTEFHIIACPCNDYRGVSAQMLTLKLSCT